VTHLTLGILLGAVGEDGYLLALAVLKSLGNNLCAFNVGGAYNSAVSDIVRHLDYMRRKAGIDALALGSDFDGISCELELADCSWLPRLVDALGSCFTDGEIEKICRGNALRLFRDVIGE